jgi:hypothetical protein
MPEKPNAPKKKAKPLATRRAPKVASTKAKTSKRERTFYLTAPDLSVIVSDKKPETAARAPEFTTFDEAKRAAIDALVGAIEGAEARLLALKRAEGYEALRDAGQA